MDKGRIAKPSEQEGIEAVSQVMNLTMEFDGAQLKERRRFVDLLLQLRQQQGRDGE